MRKAWWEKIWEEKLTTLGVMGGEESALNTYFTSAEGKSTTGRKLTVEAVFYSDPGDLVWFLCEGKNVGNHFRWEKRTLDASNLAHAARKARIANKLLSYVHGCTYD